MSVTGFLQYITTTLVHSLKSYIFNDFTIILPEYSETLAESIPSDLFDQDPSVLFHQYIDDVVHINPGCLFILWRIPHLSNTQMYMIILRSTMVRDDSSDPIRDYLIPIHILRYPRRCYIWI